MRKLFVLLGAVLVVLTGALSAAPASADDGNFSVWRKSGLRCDFPNSTKNMGLCANDNIIIQNSGYPCSGCDTIRLYWGYSYTGAWICIPRGVTYGQGSHPGLTFDRGAGNSGFGDTVWNNAASAKWTGPC